MSDLFVPIASVVLLVLISQIKRAGHSRIPVRGEGGEFVGLLYLKDLVGQDLPLPLSRVYRDINASSRLDTVLSRCIQTRHHMFVVVDTDDRQTGIITLEDVIEEILKREIEDEFDEE